MIVQYVNKYGKINDCAMLYDVSGKLLACILVDDDTHSMISQRLKEVDGKLRTLGWRRRTKWKKYDWGFEVSIRKI